MRRIVRSCDGSPAQDIQTAPWMDTRHIQLVPPSRERGTRVPCQVGLHAAVALHRTCEVHAGFSLVLARDLILSVRYSSSINKYL